MLERLRGAPGAGLGVGAGVGAIPSSWFAEQVRAGSRSWFELVRAGSHDTYPLMGIPEVNFEFIFGSAVKNYS